MDTADGYNSIPNEDSLLQPSQANAEKTSRHLIPSMVANLKAISKALSLLTLSFGLAIILGWIFDVNFLHRTVVEEAPLAPSSALCLIFLSLSLWFCESDGNRTVFKKTICRLSAICALTTSALIGAHYFAGLPLDLDRFLLSERIQPLTSEIIKADHMAPNSACAFMLLSLSLILMTIKHRKAKELAEGLSLIVLFIGSLAATGYLYQDPTLYEFGPYTPMAFPAALMFVFLPLAILFINPETGFMSALCTDSVGGEMVRQLLPTAVSMPLILGWLRVVGQHAGLYDTAAGTSYIIFLLTLLFVGLIFRGANYLTQLDEARKSAERSWQEIQQRSRLILDRAPDAFVAMNGKGEIIDWNRQAEHMFGWQKGEVAGKPLVDVIIPADRRALHAEGLSSFVTGEPSRNFRRLEIFALDRHGREFPAELCIFPVNSDPGVSVCAFIRDISQRKIWEQSLRKSEERFRLLVSNVRDYAIFMLDPNGKVVTWNEGAERIIGHKGQEIIGQHFSILFPPQDREAGKPDKELVAAKEHGKIEGSGWRLRKDGTLFWAHIALTAVRDEEGELLGFTKVAQDQTERKKAEDQINQLNESLARRLIELDKSNRQLELLSSNLVLARDEALDASELKSRFVANISHELRTPISSVIGMTELLCESPLNDEQRHCANIIHESSQVLLHIINDILDFSKIEAGKLDLEKIPLSATTLLYSSAQLMEAAAEEKGLTIRVVASPLLPKQVEGDPDRIRQIILNLLSNAIKFTESGEIILSATTTDQTESSVGICFSVTDMGIGISDDMRQKLFSPFMQADGSTTRKYGGTGLGLSICKRLTDLMGGKIGCDNKAGVGCRFWFTVPFARSDQPSSVLAKAKAPTHPEMAEVVNESFVLIAEDNSVLREVALKQLERIGYAAQAVANGKELLAELKARNYALVLMDCQMPEMDGYEATQAIRQMEKETGEHIPIVAMTASAMEGDKQKCLDSGMDDYLSKPVRLDNLKKALDHWLPKPIVHEATRQREVPVESGEVSHLSPLDLKRLTTTYGAKNVQEILPLFQSEAASLLQKLQEAAREKDAPALARVAHQLSGLSSSVAADKLHELSYGMEMAAKKSDWDSINASQPNLEGCMSEAREFVGKVLADASSYFGVE
jgi:PAS domain S-box-containing protein